MSQRSIPALAGGPRRYAHLLPVLELEIAQGNRLLSGFNAEPDGWYRAYFSGPLHLGLIRSAFAFEGDVSLDAGPEAVTLTDLSTDCQIVGGAG